MKKQICIIILFLTCRICNAQNLVPNGNFELYTNCPTGTSQLYSAQYWINPATNITGVSGTPDYFNQCSGSVAGIPNNIFGYQPAHSGVGYCGIHTWVLNNPNYREYIEVPLTSSLLSNHCYHFEMYANCANSNKYATDKISIYFSNTAITGVNNSNPLPFTPQINNASGFISDTLNWTLISGTYVASGGESYLLIGNFSNDANTNTILINTLQYNTAYLYIDDVLLTPCTSIEEQTHDEVIKIYPNPFSEKLSFTINNKQSTEIILYDIASKKILQHQFTNSISLNTKQLAKGLYLYEIRSKDGSCKKGKVVKD